MQLLMGIKPCTDPLPKDLTNDYSNSYLAPFSEGAKYKLNPSEALLGGLETYGSLHSNPTTHPKP